MIHMINPLDTCVTVVMEDVTDQMFVQQEESLLLRKKVKRKRKEHWQFDNDITYRGRNNVMMFILGTRKIVMAPVLHFDKNLEEKKSSFMVMTLDEKELDEIVKENDFFVNW
ncbi:hypothetical protein KIW84_045941 [Lathyrus oleraceus]|uniref:Uncharacterized protein n=1 Tax=Pisum sativum TaxID=3888 RepID=A0A9D4XLX7_PEA|nr:hypothetical protein KIW84_045941 [Pisum sativum]